MRFRFVLLGEMAQQLILWIVMKFSTNIHVPLRMNCLNFGEPLTSNLAPSSDQHVNVSNTLAYHQINQN